MNADNKEPNLSSEPLETDRFLTGSIKALDRVCVGLPFKHPLSCSGRTYCSRLQQFGALNHWNSELWDTDAVYPGWLCAESMQNPMNPYLHEEFNGANECGKVIYCMMLMIKLTKNSSGLNVAIVLTGGLFYPLDILVLILGREQ